MTGVMSDVKLVLYDEVLYGEGHLIGRFASQVTRDARYAVRATAPVNKRPNRSGSWAPSNAANLRYYNKGGTLKNGITARSRRVGPRDIEATIISKAPYTMAVIDGVGARRRKGSSYYNIPLNPGKGIRRKKQKLAGFTGRDFVSDGIAVARAKHPCLSGFRRI